MTSKAALFALFALWGVGNACAALPASAGEAVVESASESSSKRGFADRVWVKAESDLPSVIRIFMSDGTLVSDSCWETHRLSPWHMTSETALTWNEDGMDIAAEILSVSTTDLVLRLDLIGGAVEERYVAATVPYVCPDIPKA